MRRRIFAAAAAGLLATLAIAGPVRGQNSPPPPPPPNGGTPLPGPPPPCPPTGCATATPTATPILPTATATSTPTATPTNTPVPLFVQVKLAHKSVRVGQKQKVTVTTLPNASVKITVAYPNHKKKSHSSTAGADGVATWSYKQAAGYTTAGNNKAKVTASADNGSGSALKASKTYTIK